MNYTLDASALLAYLKQEKGYDKVKKVLKENGKPFIHAINLLEVEYKIKAKMPSLWKNIKKRLEKLPLTTAQLLIPEITDYARHLKATYALSLADSIGLSLNEFLGTTFLTADRQELESIKKQEGLKIEFLR